MEKKVGQVTPEESATIQKLHERRNGLVELAKIIDPSNEALYEKTRYRYGQDIGRLPAVVVGYG